MRYRKFVPRFVLSWLVLSIGASAKESDSEAFSMKIMDAFAITGRGTVLRGQVATGSLTAGDTVCVPLDSGKILARKVDGIESFRKIVERAEPGKIVGILVQDIDSKTVTKQAELKTNCRLE